MLTNNPTGASQAPQAASQGDVYMEKLKVAVSQPGNTVDKTGVSTLHQGMAYCPVTPATQKAKGMVTLAEIAKSFVYKMPRTAIATDFLDVKNAYAAMNGGTVFARPCPITPMHGFVDSITVSSLDELTALYTKARKADPKAELLLCKLIDAQWNAIVTPHMLIIGPGHDGATSGALTISVPLVGTLTQRWKAWATQGGVASGDVPFLELVADNRWWMTQLRGGPSVPFQVDFVPATMYVEHVVEAEGDLLEWAAKVAAFAPNTAVWHPNGSLGTHYGVHCVIHNIPILTSKAPQVGDMLTPQGLPPFDADAIRTGIVVASLMPLDAYAADLRASAVELVLLSLHHSPVLRGEHSFWLGVSCCLMARLGIAAALGEWRHAPSMSDKSAGDASPFHGWDRSKVYNHTLGNVFQYRKILPNALASFLYGGWGGGFGGKKWASCAQSIVLLDQAMHGIFEARDDKTVVSLISALNVAVNQAHNNGWWMNKFIPQASFDLAAQGDLATPLNALPAIIEIIKVVYTRMEEVEATLYRWQMAAPLSATATTAKAQQALAAPLLPSVHASKQGKVKVVINPDGTLGTPLGAMPQAPPPAPLLVDKAQWKPSSPGTFHTQVQFHGVSAEGHHPAQGKEYISFAAAFVKGEGMAAAVLTILNEQHEGQVASMSGSGVQYTPINLKPLLDTITGNDSAANKVPYTLWTVANQQVLVGDKPVIIHLPLAEMSLIWSHINAKG